MFYVDVKVTTIKQLQVEANNQELAERIALGLAMDSADAGSNAEVVSVEEDTRKYTNIHVKKLLAINSSGDYYADVLLKKAGRRVYATLHLNTHIFPGHKMPKYVIDETLSQLRQLAENGKLQPYECDRNGSKRFENLRYYNHETLKQLIAPQEDTPCPQS